MVLLWGEQIALHGLLKVFDMVGQLQGSFHLPWTKKVGKQILLHYYCTRFPLTWAVESEPPALSPLPSPNTLTQKTHKFSFSPSSFLSCFHIGLIRTKGSESVRVLNTDSLPAVTSQKLSEQPWRGTFLQGLPRPFAPLLTNFWRAWGTDNAISHLCS